MAVIYNMQIPATSESLDLVANPIAGFLQSKDGNAGMCVYRSRLDGGTPYLGFELTSDGNTATYRTEIGGDSVTAGTGGWGNGDTVALRFRMSVEDFLLAPSDEALLMQIHQIQAAAPAFSPPVALVLTSTGYVAYVRRSLQTPFAGAQRLHLINLGGVKPGDIDDFVFVMTVATAPSSGTLEIWRNGTRMASISVPVRMDIAGGSTLYAKAGVYMPGWSSSGGAVGRFVKTRLYKYVCAGSYAEAMAV